MNTSKPGVLRTRAILIALCLALALAAAFFVREKEEPLVATTTPPAVEAPPQTAAQILAAIPEWRGDSATDIGIAKARARAGEQS
jgi:hypothetical protein